MKHPHIPFYTGDWMKDPKLSLCMPATRGVWIDLLCAMHELDRSGELCGTTEQLARLARCSTVELVQALTDLQTNHAAEVQQRNGSWTVANFRMKREHATREKRADAGSKGGSKSAANREQKPDSDNDIDCCRILEEFCVSLGLPRSDGSACFHKWQGNGWTNGGEPIRDWRSTIRSWKSYGYLPSQKKGFKPSTFQKPVVPSVDLKFTNRPTREPTEEELRKNREIAQAEVSKLNEKLRSPVS